ncbi:MAG: histidinol-phosphate transaminase [Dermabacter sp.]|nr:histidinol-phosphate transaminase [Dermabacter sp.]
MSVPPPDTPAPSPFRPPLRPGLEGEVPYGAPQLSVAHPMNVNENPVGPSPRLVARIQERVGEAAAGLNRYPDREFVALRERLGAFLARESADHGHPIPAPSADQVWVANGSNEIMQQIFQAFGGPGRTALGFAPHYSMYPEYARNTLTTWEIAERGPAPDFALDAPRIRAAIAACDPTIVVLTSPNNPTGTALDLDTIREVARDLEARGGILVVDEAYAEFRRDGVPSALSVLGEHPNLIVSRTMAKAFALAGARIGYAVAHPASIDALRIVRLPYHLSAITQAVAHAALDATDELLAGVDALREARDALAEALRERGYTVADSDANFVLFRAKADRHATWQALVERGVLIREVGPPGWLRVSVGNEDNNRAFIQALSEVEAA